MADNVAEGAANDDADKRWKAVLSYQTGDTGDVTTVFFEEITDLDGIIEHGPDWNTLVNCTITLNRKLAA